MKDDASRGFDYETINYDIAHHPSSFIGDVVIASSFTMALSTTKLIERWQHVLRDADLWDAAVSEENQKRELLSRAANHWERVEKTLAKFGE